MCANKAPTQVSSHSAPLKNYLQALLSLRDLAKPLPLLDKISREASCDVMQPKLYNPVCRTCDGEIMQACLLENGQRPVMDKN